MIQSTRMQIKVLFQRKGVYITSLIILLLVIQNFLDNVFSLAYQDVIHMCAPYKLLMLSDMGKNFLLFLLYPFLIVLPAAFSYMDDTNNRETNFICSRVGVKNYYLGKLAAVFVVTFVAVIIPLLMDYFLNVVSFPLGATGDKYNIDYYQPVSRERIGNYFLVGIYVKAPYFHAFISTLFFGVCSGIFGCFAAAVSFLRVRYKVFLFLPFFILYNISLRLGNMFGFYTELSDYLIIHDGVTKSYLYFGGLLLAMICFILLVTVKSIRRGWLE